MVYNSLTRTKTRFIPNDDKTITWYQCGPTVYAESHMGHARTYVSLDVIRRILKDYLGYNVLLCQNVTDIDDKIIIRSGERGIPFRDLASRYEEEFYQDMASLGVQLPDMSTRVSEYVEEIVSYIEDLVQKEIAYESNGSVYFSVQGFEAKGHTYGKLVPEQIGNSELLAEGEGALASTEVSEKRSPSDFALWKKTKDRPDEDPNAPKEPFWESPWGHGRPGWHIECSVMSAYAMKKFAAEGLTTPKGRGSLDVHAGGVDLKFPHHENEIAQSEAYSGSHQWVNYWLHTGHLNIKGFKMSKSLKNFITIREALELHTARQLRFCFLLHKYNSTMDYGDGTMSQAVIMDKTFSEYFQNVKALLRRLTALSNSSEKVGEGEESMLEKLEAAKTDVRQCLLDDFNTPGAISILANLVRECNIYMETALDTISSVVLSSVARYVTSMMSVFGLIVDGGNDIGFPLSTTDESGGSVASKEEVITPLLDILTKFREKVRLAAIAGDTKSVLSIADELRDEILPDVGVRMEDKGSGDNVITVWKLDNPEVLKKEKEQKVAAKQAKELQKQEAARKLAEKEAKAKIHPKDMFLSMTDLYSTFGDDGTPSHDKAGEPLSKGALKKLQKEYSKQLELHEKHVAKVSGSSSV